VINYDTIISILYNKGNQMADWLDNSIEKNLDKIRKLMALLDEVLALSKEVEKACDED